MRTTLTLSVLLMFVIAAPLKAAEFFDHSFGNYLEELEIAREEGKKGVFVFFEMDDCPFCHRMKETILQEQDVIEYFHEHFKVYRFDIEGSNPVTNFDGREFDTEKEMAERQFRVRATPVMIIFDLNGEPVARFTGPTRSKEEFLLFGRFVVEGHHKEMNFNRFRRQADAF
ncbi:thioredoxin family protein [Thiomicrospira sp. ALE5]|uniref:thioredoxin family protein n=1 Tax=Thiomicrospira sp. ALE5 TaxID=748650 RepID=UPI0008ED0438|nr:thioredoxin family protein [Thiomicrospira sp. ALE5]SFR58560.1 Thioredoxin-related protein [Thiomicrospira sp. ALE5]